MADAQASVAAGKVMQRGIQCTVCCSGVVDTRLVPCGHYFHGECLMRWLHTSDCCPICKKPMAEFAPVTVTPTISPPVEPSSKQAAKVPLPKAKPKRAAKPASPRGNLRQGRWTKEEEDYAQRLIIEFKKGLLPLADGTTLRTFLAQLLNCNSMRISKKFVGESSIGKVSRRRRFASQSDRIMPSVCVIGAENIQAQHRRC